MPRNIYSRVRRITLYQQHAHLKAFFTELDAMPADVANQTLLDAIEVGREAALRLAKTELDRRRKGLPKTSPFQPNLLEAVGVG